MIYVSFKVLCLQARRSSASARHTGRPRELFAYYGMSAVAVYPHHSPSREGTVPLIVFEQATVTFPRDVSLSQQQQNNIRL